MNYQSGPDQWRAEIEAWQQRGADYVAMRAMALRGQGQGLDTPQAHIDALRLVFSKQIKGKGGDVGMALMTDIDRAVKKYSEPHKAKVGAS